jgi:hypothetical protein
MRGACQEHPAVVTTIQEAQSAAGGWVGRNQVSGRKDSKRSQLSVELFK